VDVAIAVDAGVSAGDVAEAIRRAAGNHCQDVTLFDVYAGAAVGAGKKSLAYHVLLQSPTATLSEREEQKFLGRLPRQLEPLGA
jgi:phenylalanyl-tRNA synthetase beta chain